MLHLVHTQYHPGSTTSMSGRHGHNQRYHKHRCNRMRPSSMGRHKPLPPPNSSATFQSKRVSSGDWLLTAQNASLTFCTSLLFQHLTTRLTKIHHSRVGVFLGFQTTPTSTIKSNRFEAWQASQHKIHPNRTTVRSPAHHSGHDCP